MFDVMLFKDRFCMYLEKVLALLGATPNDWTRSGLDHKKIVYLSLWEDVGILQEELKVKQRANKMENMLYFWNGLSNTSM